MSSKRLRFEVFKRDDFTCQYCGQTPPKVVLEVDHIIPKSKGGENTLENSLTACFDCNRGKGNITLTTIQKKDIIQENTQKIKHQEEQLKEYYYYKQQQKERIDRDIHDINLYWRTQHNGESEFNENGIKSLKRFLKIFTLDVIIEAIDISMGKLKNPEQQVRYMYGILHNKRKERCG